VPLAPTPAAPEKRHFKYWPEAALTSAAIICLGVFFWLDRGPSSLTSSDFSNSKRSGTVSRLNFVGLGGCIGKACETLVTIKSIPAAGISKEPAGSVILERPLDAATPPAGVIVSTAGEEISSHDESAQPAMMEHAIRLGLPDETATAPPAETETAPELVHNLDTELLDPATPSPSPDASQATTEPPSKPKQTTIKPKAPRRQGVAQPALKPAAKSAKQAAPKRGLAEANQEKTPPVQKAAPGSKPSAPVVATAKPADETVQNTYDDPPPGFQILNNLNNEFFSFQP
jgi:hypothetical protein